MKKSKKRAFNDKKLIGKKVQKIRLTIEKQVLKTKKKLAKIN